MINAWFNDGQSTNWIETDDAREIWSTLMGYLASRSHEQRLAQDRDEIKNWYLDIWDIVDKGETTPPPAFDNIVDTIYGDQFYSNITEETLANIFNIAPVYLQYRFISSLVNENEQEEDNYIADQPQLHYAGETYGDYDSEREAENTDRVFNWPNEQENSVENDEETDNENEYKTDSETEYVTDSETDSIPALIGDTDTESDDEGYETEVTVIVENNDPEEIERTELRTNVWHQIEFPWQHTTTPREYFETINGYAYDSEDESDAETETDCDSMPELLTPSESDSSDEEDQEDYDNNMRCHFQRTGIRIARTVRI